MDTRSWCIDRADGGWAAWDSWGGRVDAATGTHPTRERATSALIARLHGHGLTSQEIARSIDGVGIRTVLRVLDRITEEAR